MPAGAAAAARSGVRSLPRAAAAAAAGSTAIVPRRRQHPPAVCQGSRTGRGVGGASAPAPAPVLHSTTGTTPRASPNAQDRWPRPPRLPALAAGAPPPSVPEGAPASLQPPAPLTFFKASTSLSVRWTLTLAEAQPQTSSSTDTRVATTGAAPPRRCAMGCATDWTSGSGRCRAASVQEEQAVPRARPKRFWRCCCSAGTSTARCHPQTLPPLCPCRSEFVFSRSPGVLCTDRDSASQLLQRLMEDDGRGAWLAYTCTSSLMTGCPAIKPGRQGPSRHRRRAPGDQPHSQDTHARPLVAPSVKPRGLLTHHTAHTPRWKAPHRLGGGRGAVRAAARRPCSWRAGRRKQQQQMAAAPETAAQRHTFKDLRIAPLLDDGAAIAWGGWHTGSRC